MKILIGTNNLNKYINYTHAFSAYAPNIKLVNPAELKISDDLEEDGTSLLENATKKAKFFGDKSGIITIADDTGLFVDSLNGEPGLHTKRWHSGTDHDRCAKLLQRLRGKKRTARYEWAVVAYNPINHKTWEFGFKLKGAIADEFRDKGGFGYDKMFNVVQLGKHYSELTPEELLEYGGRGRAVKELIFNTNFF